MKAPKISDVLKAKDSSQISLDDIRSQVTELACGEERFKSTEGGEMSQCLSKPWCDGVLYKDGEFSAVVYCAGCKLWEVGLTIEKGAVTELGDEVKEVKRKTSYITATEPFKFNGKKVEDDEGNIVKAVGIPTQEENVHESFFCKDAGIPIATEKPWKFGEPVRFMWAPGNTSYITCGCVDSKDRERAVRVFITADTNSAKSVQEDFERAIASTPRRPPIICIEHHEEESAVQLFDAKNNFKAKFEWDIKPEPGIYCTGSPTKLGEGNVNGKLHTSFSPSFRHDAKVATAKCEDCEKHSGDCDCGGTLYFPEGLRGSEKNPAKIVGIGRKSGGSLTNWPAFKDILPLTAKEPDATLKAAGNSEGVKKSWETRKHNSSPMMKMEETKKALLNVQTSGLYSDAAMHAYQATSAANQASNNSKEKHEHAFAYAAHLNARDAHIHARNLTKQGESHYETHSVEIKNHNQKIETHRQEFIEPEHKANEPKNKFEGVKIISSSPKSIYDGIVVNGQPAGRK